MDFIINNYIWIIVISIILIMALIGYLAEKTDFIHETKKKKIEHNEEVKAKESEESIEAPKSEIPTVALESPIHEMDATTDALGFEDPFAMSSAAAYKKRNSYAVAVCYISFFYCSVVHFKGVKHAP